MQLATPCCETGLASPNYRHARHGRALLYSDTYIREVRPRVRTLSVALDH